MSRNNARVGSALERCKARSGQAVALAPAILTAAVLLPATATAFDKQLGIGVGGGYSQLFRRQATDPISTHGGGGNLHLVYGINDMFGVSATGGMAWFAGYTPAVPVSAVDESGNPVTAYVKGAKVSKLTARDLALNLVYAIDVTRAVPYLSLGVVSARLTEERKAHRFVAYEVGLRTELGVDYQLLAHLSLGAALGLDTFFTSYSRYSSRLNFAVRLSTTWDLSKLGRGENTE